MALIYSAATSTANLRVGYRTDDSLRQLAGEKQISMLPPSALEVRHLPVGYHKHRLRDLYIIHFAKIRSSRGIASIVDVWQVLLRDIPYM